MKSDSRIVFDFYMEIERGFQFWNKKQMLRRKYKILGVEREVICVEKARKSNHKSFVFFSNDIRDAFTLHLPRLDNR